MIKKRSSADASSHNGTLLQVFNLLYARFGPQHWWPGETPFEVIVGAILTQNTAWTNVAKAIKNLKDAQCLDAYHISTMQSDDLYELLKPSGFYKIKAARLKAFIDHLYLTHDGDLQRMLNQEMYSLRDELLNIYGIGQETADSILLYAAQKPVFVIDAYTKRIFSRHGYFADSCDYKQIQTFFMDSLPEDVDMYNEYHALIVRLAKEHCKKKAVCQGCPLEEERPKHICQI